MILNLFIGTERFFKPGYSANLVGSWIPSLGNGRVEKKLKNQNAVVADIGCGHGVSTIIMAKAILIPNLLDLMSMRLL